MKASVEDCEHIHLVFYGHLGICGCGTPGEAFNLIRDVLNLVPFGEHRAQVEQLLGGAATTHLILSMLDHAGLIEHGSVIDWSWLTPKGEWFRTAAAGMAFDDIDTMEIGYPHDGADCTDTCWEAKP